MRIINSHTEGEPTRVIVEGGPPLGDGPWKEGSGRLRQFDHVRRFAVTSRVATTRWSGRSSASRMTLPARQRYLFRQRRFSRHVRPRRDRPRGHARVHGPAAARPPSHRDAGRPRRGRARRRCIRRRWRMSRATVTWRRFRSRSRASERCAETSPGAATGFSSLRVRLATSFRRTSAN